MHGRIAEQEQELKILHNEWQALCAAAAHRDLTSFATLGLFSARLGSLHLALAATSPALTLPLRHEGIITSEKFRAPCAVTAANKDGDTLYISDHVQGCLFRVEDLHELTELSLDLHMPSGLFQDASHDWIGICDWGNSRFIFIDQHGNHLMELPLQHSQGLTHPLWACCLDANRFAALVTDKSKYSRAVMVFESRSSSKPAITIPFAGGTSLPSWIAPDPASSEAILVALLHPPRICRLTLDGSLTALNYFHLPANLHSFVATHADLLAAVGPFLVASANGRLDRIANLGSLAKRPVSTALNLFAVKVGGQTKMLVADPTGRCIHILRLQAPHHDQHHLP